MDKELRKTGISLVSDMPWGTHFCYFYETRQDLLDILVPYFKAGLENKEFCLWVVTDPGLLTVDEAKGALEQAVPDFDRHLAAGQIEILKSYEWYLRGDKFKLEGIINEWEEKLERSLTLGYEGMRVSGDTLWLGQKDREDFFSYEKQLDDSVVNHPMSVLCTYSLAKSGASDVLDVAGSHQFTIARRQGKLEVVETHELIQAKQEIKRLNEKLENRISERTGELVATNEDLRNEIAERRRAEDALRQSEDQLRLVIDTTPTMSWSLRPDGVVDFLNKRWIDYTGISLEEYIKDPTGPVHPDDIQKVIGNWLVAKAAGESYSNEIRLRGSDGEYRWFLVRTAPLKDEHGNVIKWYGVSTDIEDRKRVEAKLRESEDRFRQMAESITEVFWLTDPDKREMLYVSPGYEMLWGRSCESIYEQPSAWMDAIHPDDRERVKNSAKTQQVPGSYDEEYRIIRPDGSIRWIRDRAFPIKDKSGRVYRITGIAEDITESKAAEDQLKATTEQLRALSGRLQFAKEEEGTRIAREIHDELGSALTSLRWDLESFDKSISKSTDRTQRQILRDKIATMLKLTETAVGTVRRISSELRPTVLDDLGLAPAIEWQAEQFQNRTGIVCRCDCDIDDLVLSPERSTAVFRIFQEALTNILRHADASRVEISITAENGVCSLTVHDNGRGITDDEIADPRSLGILGMHERANLVGGEIVIRGAAGIGTYIILLVPIAG